MEKRPVSQLMLNGAWLVKAANGEYLDVEVGKDGAPKRFVTVPVSRVRHLFRFAAPDEWAKGKQCPMLAEPVPMEHAGAVRGVKGAPLAPAVQLPVVVAHDGCMGFRLTLLAETARAMRSLTVSPLHDASRSARGRAMAVELMEGIEEKRRFFAIDMNTTTLLQTSSTVGFPQFEGEAKRAIDVIAQQLRFDPHGDRLDEAALDRLHRPNDISESAWQQVCDQLRLEIHYRFLCKSHFEALTHFVQNVFIANSGVVETVGGLVKLDKNQGVNLLIQGMFSLVAKGVGALPFPGSGVVSGALGALFSWMLQDQGPNAATLAVALVNARDGLADLFNKLITSIQKMQGAVYSDWGKLSEMGMALEREDGSRCWPEEDGDLRREASRLMEISVWKDLVKIKWHHMTSSDDPAFLPRYTEADKQAYESKNRNYWVEYRAGTETNLFGKKSNGFYVTYHWLGYGNMWVWHHEPDNAMCDRLFTKLKVTRQEVFTDTSWNLGRETFLVQNYPVPM